MIRRGGDRTTPWTPAEGARDVLAFQARRSVYSFAAWTMLLLAVRPYVNMLIEFGTGATLPVVRTPGMGRLTSGVGRMVVAMASTVGFGVGLIATKGLVERVRFGGWIPASMAFVASSLVIGLETAVFATTLPPVAHPILWMVAAIGAFGSLGGIALGLWMD